MRATAQDRDAAQQMGVDVNAREPAPCSPSPPALGGVSGLLVGMYYNHIDPAMSFQATLKGVVAQVVGGVGNVPGAIAGSLLLGLVESYGVALFGTSYRNLFAFVLLVLVLVLRPNGLFASARQAPPEPLTGTFIAPEPAGAHPALGAAGAAVGASRCCRWCSRIAYVLQTLTNAWLYAMLALSLTLVAGTVGQVSLGHAGAAGDRRLCLGAAGAQSAACRSASPSSAAGLITAALGTLLIFAVVPAARALRLDRDARRSARSCRW